jgi:transposase InsO family protein
MFQDKQTVIELIDEACSGGARLSAACELLGVSPRTMQRWRQQGKPDRRKAAARQRTPGNKLSEQERDKILRICNQPEFSTMSPNQIVPALADKGIYVASEASFYRVLRNANQLAHRGKAKPQKHKRPESLEANGPNQLWSWDITYLPTTVKGLFFYLYLIMDVYSRKIVGWEVFDTESADHASSLIRKTYLREGIAGAPLVLHSDNGSPMKGATMLVTLQKLGVMPSFSRPSVSNDNAYSEALFKTLKYNPGYPDKPFVSIEQARSWVAGFQCWYNESHHHSALKFVTPNQRHNKEDIDILANRKSVYETARKLRPERWSGSIRDWEPEQVVYLNPKKPKQSSMKAA